MKKMLPIQNIRKLTKCAKLVAVNLLIVSLFCVTTNNLYGQSSGKTISTKFSNHTLVAALQEVNKLSDNSVIFVREEVSKQTKKVTLTLNSVSVLEAVKQIVNGTNLSCVERSGRVVIIPGAEVQNKVISGVVLNKLTKEPIQGVTIVVKEIPGRGCATDENGKFEINLGEKGKTLLISIIGMKSMEITFDKSQSVTLYLEESELSMEKIIVTGYQAVEKRYMTSSVSTIKTDELNMIGASSVDQMLQGQVAGLSIVNTSVAPGATPKIRVRGTSTISGNADPLWVLDGVILETSVPISTADLNSPDVMEMFNSVIGGVSPNDIESITVLKDASATAIYGTRAANGVIVVTTKRGMPGAPAISYKHTSTIKTRPTYNDFDLLNSQQRVNLTLENYDDGLTIWKSNVGMEGLMSNYMIGNISLAEYQSKTRLMEARNTDWFKLLFRNAYAQTHDLSVSGGTEKADYYISASYSSDQGLDKVTNYNNLSGSVKVNAELFKGVNFGINLQAGRRDRETYHQRVDPFKYAVRTTRTIPVYAEDGSDYFYYSTDYGYLFNILNEQKNTHRESTQADIKAIANLDVKLAKGLKYKGMFSYAQSNSNNMNYATDRSAVAAGVRGYDYGEPEDGQDTTSRMPYGGLYNQTDYDQRTSIVRNGLEYKTDITRNLSMDLMAGQEFRTTNYNGLISENYGYMHDRGNIFFNPVSDQKNGHLARNKSQRNISTRSNISYYGVASAMYKDLYVVNANIRFDGSNLFGSNPKYRYLPLWSVSGKWMMINESFMESTRAVLSHFALRASYGLRGNIVDDSTPQLIASALPPNPITGLIEMEIFQAPNPNLKWETTASLNFGLELAMFDDRVMIDVDYYRDYSRDLIAFRQISAVSGFDGKYVNYADVKNSGVDVALSAKIINKKEVSWSSSLNLGYVNNRVVKSSITPNALNLIKSTYTAGEVYEGKPVNAMFSYKFAGLNSEGMPTFYGNDGKAYGRDDAEMALIPYDVENLEYSGTRDPIISGGFNNSVKFNNFTLSMLLSFGLKNVVRLPEMAYEDIPSPDQNANSSILNRWRPGQNNDGKVIPTLSGGSSYFIVGEETFYTTSMFNQSQQSIVPGDYLRLRNIMIECRLPMKLAKNISVGGKQMLNLSLKFQAQNLFVIADKRLKGYDPETVNYTTTGYGSLPLPRTYTLGLNINF